MNLRPQDKERRTALAASVLETRIHRDATVPRTSVVGAMRLLSRRENADVRAEARAAIEKFATGLAVDGFREFHEELAVRTIAIAMRDPSNREQPLAPLSDWMECDDDQINALWQTYQDLEVELDPFEADDVTNEEAEQVIEAAKKKGGVLLTSFGSRKLAHSVRILVARLEIYETAMS